MSSTVDGGVRVEVVVDTSVIIAVIANEPKKPALVERTAGATLLAPASIYSEIGNAFSAMRKTEAIDFGAGKAAVQVFHALPVRWLDVKLGEALKLAGEFQYLRARCLRHSPPLWTRILE